MVYLAALKESPLPFNDTRISGIAISSTSIAMNILLCFNNNFSGNKFWLFNLYPSFDWYKYTHRLV